MKLIDHRTIPDQQPKRENQHPSVEIQQINTRVNHQIMGDENRAKTRLDKHNLKTIFFFKMIIIELNALLWIQERKKAYYKHEIKSFENLLHNVSGCSFDATKVESNHSIKTLNIARVLDNHMISIYWLFSDSLRTN